MAFVHTSQDASTAFLFFPIRRANVFVVLVPFCKANATLINFDMLFAITNKTLHSCSTPLQCGLWIVQSATLLGQRPSLLFLQLIAMDGCC